MRDVGGARSNASAGPGRMQEPSAYRSARSLKTLKDTKDNKHIETFSALLPQANRLSNYKRMGILSKVYKNSTLKVNLSLKLENDRKT